MVPAAALISTLPLLEASIVTPVLPSKIKFPLFESTVKLPSTVDQVVAAAEVAR